MTTRQMFIGLAVVIAWFLVAQATGHAELNPIAVGRNIVGALVGFTERNWPRGSGDADSEEDRTAERERRQALSEEEQHRSAERDAAQKKYEAAQAAYDTARKAIDAELERLSSGPSSPGKSRQIEALEQRRRDLPAPQRP